MRSLFSRGSNGLGTAILALCGAPPAPARSSRPAPHRARPRHERQNAPAPPQHRHARAGKAGGGGAADYDRAVEQFLERRRSAAAAAWDADGGVVLVEAGEEIPLPGRGDRTYPFRAHSEHLYLTDRERPGGVLAFDPGVGLGRVRRAGHRPGAAVDGAGGLPRGRAGGDAPAGRTRGVRGCLAAAPPWGDAGAGRRTARRADPRPAAEGRRRGGADAGGGRGDAGRFAELVPLIEAGRSERELQVALRGSAFCATAAISRVRDHRRRGRPRRRPALHADRTGAPRRRAAPRGRGRRVPGYASDVTRTYAVSGTFAPERRWSTRRCGGPARPRSPPAGRGSSGGRSTARRRWSSRTVSSSWACFGAVASRWSRAAP